MLNNITLMGRLTADPDYRTTQSGVALAKFTLAVERDYSGSDGERATDFLDVAAWRLTADFVSRYFHKGQLVCVTGSVQVENYTDSDGNKRRSWSVQANHCYFAEPKRDAQQGQPQSYQPPQNPGNAPGYPQQRRNVDIPYEPPRNAQGGYNPPGYQQAAYGGYAQQPQPQPPYQGQPYQGQQTQMNGYGQPQPSPYQAGYQNGDFTPVNDGDLPF